MVDYEKNQLKKINVRILNIFVWFSCLIYQSTNFKFKVHIIFINIM